ncbi:MAG: SDR family oxidoreductase [Leptolyngbyaceae cyanobacterium CRU_2_3]|nr:SDR family oxidoreductase [Leptolyngbyaceae cyanobacterium CRU_2_3]
MVSIQDQIVLITGASSGIGSACAQSFAQAGTQLILAARRLDRLEELAAELKQQFNTQSYLLALDVCDRSHVKTSLDALPAAWKQIDILINNAGLSRGLDKLQEGNIQDWEEMIDTNIKGLLYVTREIVPGMVSRGNGQVINMGSIAGHQTYPGGNVYCATKAAVRALSEGLKMDLLGTPVRVCSVDPGMVETAFSQVRFHGDAARAAQVYQGVTPLSPEDIADIVLFCATRPPHVNISDVVVFPTDQASATLVHVEVRVGVIFPFHQEPQSSSVNQKILGFESLGRASHTLMTQLSILQDAEPN